jgi:hypothetical protein
MGPTKRTRTLMKVFKDHQGRVVLAQFPNKYLFAWLLFTAVNKLPLTEGLSMLVGIFSFVAVIIWAGLELFLGVNYFRRLLGITVLVYAIASRLSLL